MLRLPAVKQISSNSSACVIVHQSMPTIHSNQQQPRAKGAKGKGKDKGKGKGKKGKPPG